jgi:O-antigen/teichoic acid export membrane protein
LIARNQILAAVANLILNLVLIPAFGFMGAALSTLLSFSFLAGLQALSGASFLTWHWPLKSLWRVLVASAIMGGIVFLIGTSIRTDTTTWQVINLLVSITVGVLIYALILWGFGEISPLKLLDLFRAEDRITTTKVPEEIG